jgi:ribosomal protein L7Ae-like RNA K-turn-binding protein
MNDKLLSFLGLCRRARKLVIGADSTIDSIVQGRARLVVLAKDFSKSSAKPVLTAAQNNNVKALTINRGKDEISPAIGRLCGVAAVEDEGFAKKLILLIDDDYKLGGE